MLELKHVHLFNLAPVVGVHTALVCNTTMHSRSQSDTGTRVHKETSEGMPKDLQATGTCAAAASAVNLAT